MLKNIGKITKVKKVIQRAIKLVRLHLQPLVGFEHHDKVHKQVPISDMELQDLQPPSLPCKDCISKKPILFSLRTNRLTKDPKRKKPTDVLLVPSFRNDVVYTLKAIGHIVSLLRLVDNEKTRPKRRFKKLSMTMKISIRISLQSLIEDEIANFGTLCMQHKSNIEMNCEVLEGLYKCIDKFVDHIHNDLSMYKITAAKWWKIYKAYTPHLQNLVIKVLSLTCSSSKSSIIEIHSKKRSRLEDQNFQDLVYVKYNQALQEHYECCNLIDSIVLNDIDDRNEWIVEELGGGVEEELVFDDVLTRRDVASATRAAEPLKYTRRQTKMQTVVVASLSRKEKGKRVVEEDEEESSEDEGEEEYNSSACGSNEDNDTELGEDDEESY
ncbi:hypothetical protein CR513_23642, partial [Mucuna pruriens]